MADGSQSCWLPHHLQTLLVGGTTKRQCHRGGYGTVDESPESECEDWRLRCGECDERGDVLDGQFALACCQGVYSLSSLLPLSTHAAGFANSRKSFPTDIFCKLTDNTEISKAALPSLKVSVVSCPITEAKSAADFPDWGDCTPHTSITDSKVAGLTLGEPT